MAEIEKIRRSTSRRGSASGALAQPKVLGPRVFLVRHADASEGERDPQRGRHLSALGQRQAQELARRLANWQLDAILCSDMHRAHDTAAAVHRFHPDVPLIVDATFREVSAGTVAACEEQEGEESENDLMARLEAAWTKIVTLPYGVAVVVMHNGLIKYLLGRALKVETALKPRFHSAQTGVTALQVKKNGRASLQFFNDTHHLSPEIAAEAAATGKGPWIEDATGRWHFGPVGAGGAAD